MAAGYKKGDRVRVTLEATVTHPFTDDDAGLTVRFDDAVLGERTIAHPLVERGEASFEKIEPPVEVFKPGDVVRLIADHSLVYTLGTNGYFAHRADEWRPTGGGNHWKAGPFTREEYERVDLS